MWVVQEDEDLDWWNTSCQSTVCVFTYTSKHHIHYCISRSNKFFQVSLHFVFPFGSLFMLLNAFNPFYESSDDCIWHLLWRPSKSCQDVWTRNYQEWRSPCVLKMTRCLYRTSGWNFDGNISLKIQSAVAISWREWKQIMQYWTTVITLIIVFMMNSIMAMLLSHVEMAWL